MSTLTGLYGVAGSGKSTKLEGFKLKGYLIFDDFLAHRTVPGGGIDTCRDLDDIVDALRRSLPCVIVDIELCKQKVRNEVVALIRERFPPLEVEWHYFDCTSEKAVERIKDNIRLRAEKNPARDAEHELKHVEEYITAFTVEKGAIVYEVVCGRDMAGQIDSSQ